MEFSSKDRLDLLVLQPTAFCNLDCRYCYVPERSNPSRMTVETLRRVCKVVSNSRRLVNQDCLEILWHAGEPRPWG